MFNYLGCERGCKPDCNQLPPSGVFRLGVADGDAAGGRRRLEGDPAFSLARPAGIARTSGTQNVRVLRAHPVVQRLVVGPDATLGRNGKIDFFSAESCLLFLLNEYRFFPHL